MEARRVLVLDITRKLTRKQKIIIGHLTYSAAKLWNVANYTYKTEQSDLCHLKHNLKNSFWFRNLQSHCAQAVIEKLQVAWKSYHRGHTDKPPGYQPKNGHFPVRWKKDGFKFIKGKLKLSLSKQTRGYLRDMYNIESRYLWLELPKIPVLDVVQEVEVVPKKIYGHWRWFLHIIYKKEVKENSRPERKKTMAVDLGVRNLATAVVEGLSGAFIFDGGPLLSKLRWFTKERSRVQSVLEKQGLKSSSRMHRLVVEEHAFVRDYVHKMSRWIVDLAVATDAGCIVVGDMHRHITEMDIGSQNNEKLHRIPFGKLVKLITYKAEEKGIEVVSVNESYTSQTCSVCGAVDRNSRKHRGLYVCGHCGTVLNADVNGARNILFRVAPNLLRDRGSGLGHPRRIRVLGAPNFA